MKQVSVFILIVSSFSPLFSEGRSMKEILALPARPAPSIQSPDDYFNDSLPLQESVLLGQSAAGAVQRNLTGFGGMNWKSTYTEVRSHLKNLATATNAVEKVEILFEARNETILVRRNDVLYSYNFYRTPFEVRKLKEHDLTQEEFDQGDAQLFHVKIVMLLLPSESVQKRLVTSYGNPGKTTVDKKTKQGADIWELGGGWIFQWYEPFHGKAFTRTLDYLSQELTSQILEENKEYFEYKELDMLNALQVR